MGLIDQTYIQGKGGLTDAMISVEIAGGELSYYTAIQTMLWSGYVDRGG
jgi:hypothetical protein